MVGAPPFFQARIFALAMLALLGPRAPAWAEDARVAPVTVTAKHPPAPDCAPIAGHPDYACLNARLAATVQGAKPTPAPSTFDIVGNGQPDKVGTFSQTGIAEQLGSSFGKSVFPQRPPPPAHYSPPLSPPRHVRPK